MTGSAPWLRHRADGISLIRIRDVALPAFAIAFANLALLGLLIEWEGASRAYVRLETLFRDHLPAVAVSLLLVLVLGGIAGGGLRSLREVGVCLLAVLAMDAIAGLAVVAAIGELTLIDLPRAVFIETAGGLQLIAAAVAVVAGYVARRAFHRGGTRRG